MNSSSKDYFEFIDYESMEDVDSFLHNLQGPRNDLTRNDHPAKDPKNWILYVRSVKFSKFFVTSYKSIKANSDDFPNLETVIDKWYYYSTKDPYLAMEYLKYTRSSYAREAGIVIKKTIPEAMNLISSEPDTALDYAKNILNEAGAGKRFTEGEGAILSCPISTIGYIEDVLNYKIPDDIISRVESIVSEDGECSLVYAKRIKKQPFPLGEKAISECPDYSLEYAKDVLKGRFILGEDAISRRDDLLLKYAITVVGGKLPEKLHKKMKLNSFSN